MAASGVLIARAAFTANLDVLGVLFAIGMTTMATLIWRHAGSTDGAGGAEAKPQSGALGLLTAATLATAAVALVVTLAI